MPEIITSFDSALFTRVDKSIKSISKFLYFSCQGHFKTAFTRCRHILKTVKNVTVAKFELAFTRCQNNLKTIGNLTVKNSLQDFDAKEM